jgi:hypothetical protein
LLACGVPGSQLTWMDARVGDWTVTPRVGKPVEVNALWINALHVGARFSARWQDEFNKAASAFRTRFWNQDRQCLYDVIDCDYIAGRVDASFRPNQIFAIGGLPLNLLPRALGLQIVAKVEARLWTPLGLRSLAPEEPGYTPHYQGGVRERDGAYHRGTGWPGPLSKPGFACAITPPRRNRRRAKNSCRRCSLISTTSVWVTSAKLPTQRRRTSRAAVPSRPGASVSCCASNIQS